MKFKDMDMDEWPLALGVHYCMSPPVIGTFPTHDNSGPPVSHHFIVDIENSLGDFLWDTGGH